MKNDSLAKFYWTKDQFHEVWQLHSLKFTSLPEWCIMLINSSAPLLINDTDKKDVPCCMGDRTGNYKSQNSQMFIFKNDMTHESPELRQDCEDDRGEGESACGDLVLKREGQSVGQPAALSWWQVSGCAGRISTVADCLTEMVLLPMSAFTC